MEDIGVWWIGAQAEDGVLLEDVRAHLGRVFGRAALVLHDPRRPPDTFDPRRGQHASGRILAWLATARAASRTLAITDVDLFIPVLTFVFGEAQLGGSAAVVSLARLGQGGRLPERLRKEAVHELGHTFGLVHCPGPACAMARSATLAAVDAKGGGLCGDCRSRMRDSGGVT